MKIKRLFAAVSAVVTLISMLGTCFVSAEDIENTESVEKLYTLEEILAMSEEEFLNFWDETANYHANIVGPQSSIRSYDEYVSSSKSQYNSLDQSGRENFFVYGAWLIADYSNYQANITENKMKEVMGDTLEYTIESPIYSISKRTQCTLYNSEFIMEIPSLKGLECTDENLLYNAKIWLCVGQVFFSAMPLLTVGSVVCPSNDVNIDGTVDLYDVIWITKYIAQIYEFPDGQKAVADISGDGVVNVVDAIMLAEHVNSQEVM